MRFSPSQVRPAAGVVGALLLWEVLVRLTGVSSDIFPGVPAVARELWRLSHNFAFWLALALTLRSWLLGLSIALVAGTAFGALLGLQPRMEEYVHDTVEFLRPIPSVALIPLAVLLYGTGLGSALMLIIFAAFWQMLLQTIHGVRDVDRVANDMARVYRIRGWSRLFHLVLPSALPYMLTGLRLASSVALILALTAELIIGTPGLGKEIALAEQAGATAEMFALVFCAGILGVVANLGVRALESTLLSWHPSRRQKA